MLAQDTLEGKVLTAAMDLAASPGWGEVSLRDIADAAGCSLADTVPVFPSKTALVQSFFRAVDLELLKNADDVEREQEPKDAVFEVVMARFDLLNSYKPAIRSIVAAEAALLPDLGRIDRLLASQNVVLQAAGVSASGADALLRKIGLAIVTAQVFRIWLDDDDPGMARTMAALDSRLRSGASALSTFDEIQLSAMRMGRLANNSLRRALRCSSVDVVKSASERTVNGDAP